MVPPSRCICYTISCSIVTTCFSSKLALLSEIGVACLVHRTVGVDGENEAGIACGDGIKLNRAVL